MGWAAAGRGPRAATQAAQTRSVGSEGSGAGSSALLQRAAPGGWALDPSGLASGCRIRRGESGAAAPRRIRSAQAPRLSGTALPRRRSSGEIAD